MRDAETVNSFLKQLTSSCNHEGSQIAYDSLEHESKPSASAIASPMLAPQANAANAAPATGPGVITTRRGAPVPQSFQPNNVRPEYLGMMRNARHVQDVRARQVQYNPSLFRQQLSGLVQQNQNAPAQPQMTNQGMANSPMGSSTMANPAMGNPTAVKPAMGNPTMGYLAQGRPE